MLTAILSDWQHKTTARLQKVEFSLFTKFFSGFMMADDPIQSKTVQEDKF